jgi:hypothetical protein
MSNPEQANGTGGGAGGDGGSGSITDGAGGAGRAMYGNGYESNTGMMDSRRPMAGSGRMDNGAMVEPGMDSGQTRRRAPRTQWEGE